MSTPIDAKVAFFSHLGAKGRNLPVRGILEGIQSGRWADKIAKLREQSLFDFIMEGRP